MKQKEKSKVGRLPQAQVSFTHEELAVIDGYAKKLMLSRSNFLRNLVLASLDDVRVLDAIGVVGVVGLVRSLNEASGMSAEEV